MRNEHPVGSVRGHRVTGAPTAINSEVCERQETLGMSLLVCTVMTLTLLGNALFFAQAAEIGNGCSGQNDPEPFTTIPQQRHEGGDPSKTAGQVKLSAHGNLSRR